jgi:hypothetical protein
MMTYSPPLISYTAFGTKYGFREEVRENYVLHAHSEVSRIWIGGYDPLNDLVFTSDRSVPRLLCPPMANIVLSCDAIQCANVFPVPAPSSASALL